MKRKPRQEIDRFTWLTQAGEPATDSEKARDRAARIAQEHGTPYNPADILDHRNNDLELITAKEAVTHLTKMVGTSTPKTKPERAAWNTLKRDLMNPLWLCNPVHVSALAKLYQVPEAVALRAAHIAAEKKNYTFSEHIAQALAEAADDFEGLV